MPRQRLRVEYVRFIGQSKGARIDQTPRRRNRARGAGGVKNQTETRRKRACISSVASGDSGPGLLCVHMYVFAGVTAIVSRNSPYAAAGVSHAGIPSIGRSADATPTPPAISATP